MLDAGDLSTGVDIGGAMRMIEVRTIEETHDGRSAVNEIEEGVGVGRMEGMVYKVLLDEGAVGGARKKDALVIVEPVC